jgi:hypothetical protein
MVGIINIAMVLGALIAIAVGVLATSFGFN